MSADTDAGRMIEIGDLWKSFGAVEVLKGVSLRVGRGGVIAIIGPSGSGKSTLLRCVNLLEEPDRGQIPVRGRERKFGGRPPQPARRPPPPRLPAPPPGV